MRTALFSIISGFLITGTVSAQQPAADISGVTLPPAQQLQWNNQAPEQRRALNEFYQNINRNSNLSNQQMMERQQRVQQLRNMTPQQRQQQFLNYIQRSR